MRKGMKRFLGITLLLIILIMPMDLYAANSTSIEYDKMFKEVMEFIKDSYIDSEELTEKELFEAAMKGMFNVLDPYSTFMTPEEEKSFTNSLRSEYVGIGVQLITIGDYIGITHVFDNSPALEKGVQKGDYFVKVDNIDVKGFTTDELLDLVLGKEGTYVDITFGRGGINYDVKLKRSVVKIPSVEYKDISELYKGLTKEQEKEIGYISISSFAEKSDNEFEEALNIAKEKNIKYLILDLRDNSGGYVNTAVNIGRKIIPKGPIVYFNNGYGDETVYSSVLEEAPFKIMALVNENSASATEFIAAGIQDSGVGKIVGETTYGKGVAQYIFNYKQGYTIKMSFEEFYSRNKNKINNIGVIPDYIIEVPNYLYGNQKYYIYDSNEGVLKIEKILDYLGYDVGIPDESYDRKTFNAIKRFQLENGLYSYGVCDFSTQAKLNEVLYKSTLENDLQLSKAISLFIN